LVGSAVRSPLSTGCASAHRLHLEEELVAHLLVLKLEHL
jgi:hypothetical protein